CARRGDEGYFDYW
nr:immunoglobulin heavy chain junction region [Mus musculus]MBK4185026.1 immunoglobulin heavy chain junction region [Mus musculus]MBK4185027.1 immunoglobulin heavy chain junction region [Mus musculus]